MDNKEITVVEISECFPNKFKPVTGEFILQHVKALSAYCKVITLVPVRYVPGREILSAGSNILSALNNWYDSLKTTDNFTTDNLSVIYFGYISLPRPYFEKEDATFIDFFFYNKLKKIISGFNPDIICCNWLRPWAEPASKLAGELNIPFIIDHHEDIPTLKKLFPDSYKFFLKTFDKADRIIVHSTRNKKELESENPGRKNITVNYLGQNFSSEHSKKNFSSVAVKLICVSHLSERRKNIHALIEALSVIKKNTDLKFLLKIIGDGNLRSEYEDLSSKLDIENCIIFSGACSQEIVGKALSESDIFVLPSYPEAFGVVFIEALAKGLPVITCIGNGGGEELKNLGYPAVLVNHDSPQELSEAIINLWNDKTQMSIMSEKGKEIVDNYFTWDKNARNTFSIIKDTISEFQSE